MLALTSMAGSKRTFTYSLIPSKPEDVERVAKHVRKILGWRCDGDKRVSCHGVTGEELGIITMSMTIQGRDRWWTTQLAQDILNDVMYALDRGLERGSVRLQLDSRAQDPHTHRGYAHGRTKRYRARSQPSSAGRTASTGTWPFADGSGTSSDTSASSSSESSTSAATDSEEGAASS